MPVSTLHPLYHQFAPLWKLCRDAAAGETQVKAEGTRYLPQPVGMNEAEYQAYKLRARFFGGPARTVDGMLGQMFRKTPILTGVKLTSNSAPSVVTDGVVEDLTPEGRSSTSLARYLAKELLTTGRVGLLADLPMPSNPGARAYLAPYEAEAILSWESQRVQGRVQLVSVVLQEQAWVKGGDPKEPNEFERVTYRRYLGLAPSKSGQLEYFQQLYCEDEDGTEKWTPGLVIYPEVRGRRLNYIPFELFGTQQGFDPAKPPILEVCHGAMSFYRTSADYENALYFAGNPTPIATGVDISQAEPLRMGSSQFNAYASPDTKVFLLELNGHSVIELRENLRDKKSDMALMGLRMLETPKRSIESAATQAMRQEGEKCYLSTLAQGISEQLSRALVGWAELSGLPHAPKIRLNQDYRPGQMAISEAAQLAKLVEQGYFPKEAYLQTLIAGELLPLNYQKG